MKKFINSMKSKVMKIQQKAYAAVTNQRGDFYISDAIRVILAVVLGALLLAAITLIFNGTVIPRITQVIQDLFN